MLAEKAAPSSRKIMFDESDDEYSSGDEGKIERELADVTFGDLQKARPDESHSVYSGSNPRPRLAGKTSTGRWKLVPRGQLVDIEKSFKFRKRTCCEAVLAGAMADSIFYLAYHAFLAPSFQDVRNGRSSLPLGVHVFST